MMSHLYNIIDIILCLIVKSPEVSQSLPRDKHDTT